MNPRTRATIILIFMAMLIALLYLTITNPGESHAATRLAPPVFCTMNNRLDIFIDEDNIMWACECEALKTGHICRWQVIGGVDSPASRKRLRSIPKRKPVWITFQRGGRTTSYLSTFLRMP